MKRSVKIGLSLLLAFVLILSGAAAVSVYWIVDHYRGIRFCYAGYDAAMRGDYDTAFASYDAAIHCKLDNRNLAVAYCGRGIANTRKHRPDAGIADLNDSIRRFPFFAQAFVFRGSAYQEKGDLSRALADFSKAIELDPNQGFALLSRGRILLRQGATDDALEDFDEAVRASPNDPQPLIDRGIAYKQKNYLSSAIASFESALRLDPNNKAAQSYREAIVANQGDQTFTMRRWRDRPFSDLNSSNSEKLSVSDLPENDWADDDREQRVAYDLLNRGLSAYRNRNFSEAVKLFTEALKHNPDFANRRAILCDRASAYEYLHMRTKSLQDYDKAIRLDPNFVEAYYNRGLSKQKMNRINDAIADYSAALRIDPRYALAYIRRGELFDRRGDVAKALTDYAEAVRTIGAAESKHRPFLLNTLAWIKATSPNEIFRDGDEALSQAIEACHLTGWNETDYIDTLAAAYAEVGNFESAVNYELWALNRYDASNSDRDDMRQRLQLYQRHQPYRTKPDN